MKNVFLVFMLFCFISTLLPAQNFLDGAYTFSSKKESYITLISGEEIIGFIDDIDRKNGLIEQIKLVTNDGQKLKLKPKDIKSMFLAPSGFDKFANIHEKISEGDLTQASKDRTMHKAYVKEGYVYFENCTVALKKGTETLLMQMVNPAFASKIKVFFDPYAKETTSLSVGGFQVAGGIQASYYVQKGDAPAYKLEKKRTKKNIQNCLETVKNSWTILKAKPLGVTLKHTPIIMIPIVNKMLYSYSLVTI